MANAVILFTYKSLKRIVATPPWLTASKNFLRNTRRAELHANKLASRRVKKVIRLLILFRYKLVHNDVQKVTVALYVL